MIGNHLWMVQSMNWKLKNKYYVTGNNLNWPTTIKIYVSTPKRVWKWYGYGLLNKFIISVDIVSVSGLDEAISCTTRPRWIITKLTNWNVKWNNIISDFSCLCSKLKDTKAKLTEVPPHYFVIDIVTVCILCCCFSSYSLTFDTIHAAVMVVSYSLT